MRAKEFLDKKAKYPEGMVMELYTSEWNVIEQWMEEYAAHKTKEMREAMQGFCDRVDNGEARSTKTYAKFKEILNV